MNEASGATTHGHEAVSGRRGSPSWRGNWPKGLASAVIEQHAPTVENQRSFLIGELRANAVCQTVGMHAFVSHNHRDKPLVTSFAAQLRLAGVDIWLDEWELHPGDSIVGKVGEALGLVDTVLLCWSEHAAASAWVNSEMETALVRRMTDKDFRIIPLRLDEAELPTLLRPLLSMALVEGATEQAVRRILGINTQAELLKRMQQTIEESGLEYQFFHGYGVVVGCLDCGAPASELEQTYEVDYSRDDRYAGVLCPRCGWCQGGEVP